MNRKKMSDTGMIIFALLLVTFFAQVHTIVWVKDPELKSEEGAWPGVFNMDPSGAKAKGSCVATMVGPRHALTAAHCFEKGEFKPFKVDIGDKEYQVDKAILNACFDHEKDGPNGGDLAIIHLSEDYTGKTYPIWTKGDEKGKKFTMMGWGNSGSYKKEKSEMKDGTFLVGHNTFDRVENGILGYTFNVDEAADNPGTLAYSGDSGGPAMIREDEKWWIVGVNSGGSCCTDGSKDEYKRLADNLNWIKSNIVSMKSLTTEVKQEYETNEQGKCGKRENPTGEKKKEEDEEEEGIHLDKDGAHVIYVVASALLKSIHKHFLLPMLISS